MLRGVLTDAEQLALKVVELAREQLLAEHPFLAPSLGRLRLWPGTYARSYVCDGQVLGYDAIRVLNDIKTSRELPTWDVMHCVLHCLFVHPYVGPTVNRRLWNLATDMAVEWQVMALCGPRSGRRGEWEVDVLDRVHATLGRVPTAELIYRELSNNEFTEECRAWEQLFACDDHAPWYPEKTKPDDSEDGREDGEAHPADVREGQKRASTAEQRQYSWEHARETASDRAQVKDRGKSEGLQKMDTRASGYPSFLSMVSPGTPFDAASWKTVAKHAAADMKFAPASRRKRYEGLRSVLQEAAPEELGYREFLRQFAMPGEVMKISEDEFDYVFYTYGLRLYGNMPLIESLEYREDKRIRDFAIVIDTSGSVWGPAVRRFVDTTFDILKSTESFFSKICLHIIQCDSQVQCDDKITSLEELSQWNQGMILHGGGGTDFRPAFTYIDSLVAQGEFENLSGVLYFTDGKGVYPETMPAYRTAFVFYDRTYFHETVPPWAMQVVLDDDEIGLVRMR